MSTESTLTFKVIWTDLPRIKTAEKQKKPALQGSCRLAPSYHSPNTKSFTQCLWGAGENFVTRVMWSATMDAVMSWLIPGAPPGLLERPSHLKIGYLPQDPQSGIHGRLPTLLFSQPFYSVSKLPEACQLRGYSCATQPELVVPSHPLLSVPLAQTSWEFYLGLVFLHVTLCTLQKLSTVLFIWGLPLASLLGQGSDLTLDYVVPGLPW